MIQDTILKWTEDTMSLLTVENLGHTFGDRTLFKDVSMRLLANEHVGLVGANGVGKSTFMNIITGQLIHDQGRIEWTPGTHYGYLDQHTILTPGRTIRDVLTDAFLPLFEKEKRIKYHYRKNGYSDTGRIRSAFRPNG